MKKGCIWLIVIAISIAIVVVITGYWGIRTYNGMVQNDEVVKKAWSDVQNQYQRRLDLIPNLVQTVKGYASHEKETLEGVISARAKATQTELNIDNVDEAALQNFQQTQSNLSSALSKLMVVVEKYPELKANQNFLQLQAQLEGTENRIAVERRRYNEQVQKFNTNVRQFPRSLVASIFGFKVYPTFNAEVGAEKAPQVDFGN